MKVFFAQISSSLACIEQNTKRILQAIDCARENGAQIVFLGELALSGLSEGQSFRTDISEQTRQALQTIADHTDDICVILGLLHRNSDGVAHNAFMGFRNRARVLLHPRASVQNQPFLLPFSEKKIGCIFGNLPENLPAVNTHFDVIIDLRARAFSVKQGQSRRATLRQLAEFYACPVVFLNALGAHTGVLFDGCSTAVNENGQTLFEASAFAQNYVLWDLSFPSVAVQADRPPQARVRMLYEGLLFGVREYFKTSGFSRALVGLSGGIDSAVTLVVLTQALGAENVLGVSLPSMFSSEHSVVDVQELCTNLGVTQEILPISPVYASCTELLKNNFAGQGFGLAEENLQSRIRAVLLMAIANKHHYLLMNTSNKSELAVGYSTQYGDSCGALSVLGDVYKTQVYELAHYMNGLLRAPIPQRILTKEPSAELCPNQKDSDHLPAYEDLDALLHELLDNKKTKHELLQQGFPEAMVERVLALYYGSQYKRQQACPVLRVSEAAFGWDIREPIFPSSFVLS